MIALSGEAGSSGLFAVSLFLRERFVKLLLVSLGS